jgi:hypothetical protein
MRMTILPSWSSTGLPGPEASYDDLIEVLNDLGVRWALAGALAAERYRLKARFTNDVDLLVAWDDRLPKALEGAGWTLRIHQEPGDPPFLIRARRESLYIDLIVALVEYQKHALERSVITSSPLKTFSCTSSSRAVDETARTWSRSSRPITTSKSTT